MSVSGRAMSHCSGQRSGGKLLVDRICLLAIGIRANGVSVVPEITFKVKLSGGKIAFVPGSQSFRPRGISQFRFFREAVSYGYVLLRAWLHRIGIAWF